MKNMIVVTIVSGFNSNGYKTIELEGYYEAHEVDILCKSEAIDLEFATEVRHDEKRV